MGGCVSLCEKLELFPKKKIEAEKENGLYLDGSFKKKKQKKGALAEELIPDEERVRKESISIELQSRRLMEEKEREIEEYNKEEEAIQQQIGSVASVKQLTRYSRKREAQQQQQYQQQARERDSARIKREEKEKMNRLVAVEQSQIQQQNQQTLTSYDNSKGNNNQIVQDNSQEIEGRKVGEQHAVDQRQITSTVTQQQGFSLLKLHQIAMKEDTSGKEEQQKIEKEDSKKQDRTQMVGQQEIADKLDCQSKIQANQEKAPVQTNELSKQIENSLIISSKADNLPSQEIKPEELLGGIVPTHDDQKLSINEKVKEIMSNSEQEELLTCANTEQRNTAKGSEEEETNEEIAGCHLSRNLDDDDEDENDEAKIKAKEEKIKEIRQSLQQQLNVVKPNNNNIVFFPHSSFSPHTRAHLHQPLSQPSYVQPSNSNNNNNTNHSHKEQIQIQQISAIGNALSASQNQNNFADETDFSLLLNNDSQKNSFIYGNFHQNNAFKDSKFILDESIIHPVRDIVNNGEDSDTSSKKEEWISDQLRKQQSTQDLVSLLQPARTSLEAINKFERQQSKDNQNSNFSENMYFPKQKAESEKIRPDSIESISYSDKRASPISSISQTPKTRYEDVTVRQQEERLSPQKMLNTGKSRGGSQDDLLPVKEEEDSHNIHGKAGEFSFCFDDTAIHHEDLEGDQQQQQFIRDDDHKIFKEMERQQEATEEQHAGVKSCQQRFSEIGKQLKKSGFERKDRKRCYSEQEATDKGSDRQLPLPDFGGCPNRDEDKQIKQVQGEKVDTQEEQKKNMEIDNTNIQKDGNNNNNSSLLSALLSISKNIENHQHRDENNNEEGAAQIVKNVEGEENENKEISAENNNKTQEGLNRDNIIENNPVDFINKQNQNISSNNNNTDNVISDSNPNNELAQNQSVDPSGDLLNFISPSKAQHSENSSKNNNNNDQEIIFNDIADNKPVQIDENQNVPASPDIRNNISIVIQDPKNNMTEQLIYTIHPFNSKISLQKPSIKDVSTERSGGDNEQTKEQQKSMNDPTKTMLYNNSNRSLLENTNRIVMQKRIRNTENNNFMYKKTDSVKQLGNLNTEAERIKDGLEKEDERSAIKGNSKEVEEEKKEDNSGINGSSERNNNNNTKGSTSGNSRNVESTLEQNSRLIEEDWKSIKGNNNNSTTMYYSSAQDRNLDDQSICNDDNTNLSSPNNFHKTSNPMRKSSGTTIFEETKTPDDLNTSDSKQICKSDSFKSFRDDSTPLNNSASNISPNRAGRSASVNYFRAGVVQVRTSADQSPFESCFNTPAMSMRGSLKVIQHDLYQRRSISNMQQVSYFKKSSVMSQQYFDCDSYELQVIDGDTLLNRDLVEHPETYMEWIQTLPVVFEIPAVLSSEALYQFELIKQETYQDFVVKLQSENTENFDLFDVIIDGDNRTIFFRSELGLDQQRIFIVMGEYYVNTRSYSQFYNFKNSFDSQHRLNAFDTLTPLNDDLQNTILVGVSTHHLLPKPCEFLFLKHFSFLQQNNNNNNNPDEDDDSDDDEDDNNNNNSQPPLEQMCEIDISLNSEEIEQHLKANKKSFPQTQQIRGEVFSGNITTAIPNENRIKVEILFEHNFHNALTIQQARNMYTEMFTAFFAKLDATFP